GERISELVDVNGLVNSTIALLKSEIIGRHVDVEMHLARDVPPVSGDPIQLQQVLLNLFMNAMDAMAPLDDASRRITVSTMTAGGSVEVRIRDSGHGIKRGEEGQLFKPFYTSKARGLGLGLAICSTIAQAHGGKLTLENHDSGGAIATLSLPANMMS